MAKVSVVAGMKAMQESHSANCPSLTEHAVLGLVSLIILEQHSRLPEANFLVFIMCGAAIVGVSLTYFVRAVTRFRQQRNAARLKPRIILSWLVFPIALALLLFSATTHWPATVRF